MQLDCAQESEHCTTPLLESCPAAGAGQKQSSSGLGGLILHLKLVIFADQQIHDCQTVVFGTDSVRSLTGIQTVGNP